MTDDEKLALFDELIEAAGTLATQADQAAVVLDERFEAVVRGPIDNVREVLRRCPLPAGEEWDGEVHAEDLVVEHFANDRYLVARDGSDADPLAVGVRITHKPTGFSRESKSKNVREDNHRIALRSLTEAVAREWAQR